MSENEIKIVRLEPMRVASAWAFGTQPEDQAWANMKNWAKPLGYLDEPGKRRLFGFNNPNPSPASPNYGYVFCLTVGPEVLPEGEIQINELSGGLYAVMPFSMGDGDANEDIPNAWRQLNAWVAQSKYRPARHQWLEEHTLEGKIALLMHPISE
jgi:AraC family transcriptional regulator